MDATFATFVAPLIGGLIANHLVKSRAPDVPEKAAATDPGVKPGRYSEMDLETSESDDEIIQIKPKSLHIFIDHVSLSAFPFQGDGRWHMDFRCWCR